MSRAAHTLIYVQLENVFFQKFDEEYISKAATKVNEVCRLVESGFEYVCDVGDAKIFRKRK